MTQNTDPNNPEAKIVVKIDEDLEDLIPVYMENIREDIDSILKALDTGDFETVRTLGHSMKGSGAGYGFDQITEIGKVIEMSAKEKDSDEVRKSLEGLSTYLDRVDVVYE